MGRFINADAYASTGQGILGNNMFAYCNGNPVIYTDNLGTFSNPCTIGMNTPGIDYLYDQEAEPFSSKELCMGTIGVNGCGVIATYNAMISLNNSKLFTEIYDYYTTGASKVLLNGKMGTNPWAIAKYFVNQGYTVRSTYNRDGIELYSTVADACILLYAYKTKDDNWGAHYVEYSKVLSGYLGRNVGGNNGVSLFLHPSDYGYEGTGFFVLGIFIFK